MAKRIYADNAATTRLLPQVLDKMLPYLTEEYGNPLLAVQLRPDGARSGGCREGRLSPPCLNGRPDEVFVTSGGSEADNWAIKMAAPGDGRQRKKAHHFHRF